jgi:hypothetical protein
MATAMINFGERVVELRFASCLEHHGIVCDGGITNYTLWEILYDTTMRLYPFGNQISYINSPRPPASLSASQQHLSYLTSSLKVSIGYCNPGYDGLCHTTKITA